MSGHSSENLQVAAEAAERLIGFYPSIMASDPKVYAGGLVQLFSRYPEHLIAEAIDPADGLASIHDFPPTLAQVKKFLEPRFQNYNRLMDLKAWKERRRLPEPPRDIERDNRIAEGFRQLSEHLKRSEGEQ